MRISRTLSVLWAVCAWQPACAALRLALCDGIEVIALVALAWPGVVAVNWTQVNQSMALLIVGMGVVFITLALIGEGVGLLARLIEFLERKPAPAEEPVAVTPATDAPFDAGVDPRLLAVLTAAAFAAVRKPVRIRAVTPLPAPAASNVNSHPVASPWAEVGRQQIQSSHNLRR